MMYCRSRAGVQQEYSRVEQEYIMRYCRSRTGVQQKCNRRYCRSTAEGTAGVHQEVQKEVQQDILQEYIRSTAGGTV